MKLSDLARPPIQPREVADPKQIETSICPYHNGLIAVSFSQRDEGQVKWCPVGRMFYRFTSKPLTGMDSPLHYRFERPI